MNKIIFRFYIVKDFDYFEVCFDSRLSFIENFKLLNDLKAIDTSNLKIYDLESNSFLCLDKPISSMNFTYYNKLYLY